MEISGIAHSFSELILLWRRLTGKKQHGRESGTSIEQGLRFWITANDRISPRGLFVKLTFFRRGLFERGGIREGALLICVKNI